MPYNAGTAYVKIRPDADNFLRDLKAKLSVQDADFIVDVRAQTAEASAIIEQFRGRHDGDTITEQLRVGTTEADARLAEWRASQEGRAVRQKVIIDQASWSGLDRQIGSTHSRLRTLTLFKLGAFGAIAATGAMGQLATVAAEAAAEIARAGQALAILPAGGFAALAGGASVGIGASGLKDAFSAYSDQSSGGGGGNPQDAINAISDAEYQLDSAQRNLIDTNRDAARGLRDLNNQLQEQKESTEDAALSVSEAQQRLNETLNDPTASQDERRRADLSYRQSLTRLQEQKNKQSDLRQDLDRANAAGVQGSSQVLDAIHQVQQAQQALNEARRGDAGGGGGVDKLAQAMAKLSPNARDFVEQVRALGPAWTDLRLADQDALFQGMGGTVTQLANTQLPNLKTGLVGVAGEINTGVRSSLLYLTSQKAQLDFSTTLSNTRLGFNGLARSMAPATEGLTTLITTGSAFLPRFGDAIEAQSKRFDNFIVKSANNGQLYDWMNDGVEQSKLLGSSMVNLGSIIKSTLHAADAQSGGLQAFDGFTEKWADFLKSTRGQDVLQSFFQNARAEFDQWQPVLEEIPPILRALLDGARAWSGVLLPFLQASASLLADHKTLVADVVIAYLGFKTLSPIIGGVEAAMKRLAATTAGQATTARIAAGAQASAAAAGATAAERNAAGALAAGSRMTQLRSAAAGALGVLGNPWVLGLAAAGAATVGFIKSIHDNADAVQRLRNQANETVEANKQLTEAFQTSGGYVDDGVLSKAEQRVDQFRKQMQDNAKDAPGWWDKTVAVWSGAANKLTGVGDGAMSDFVTRLNSSGAGAELTAAFDKVKFSSRDLAVGIYGTQEQFDNLMDKFNATGAATPRLTSALQGLRQEASANQLGGVSAVGDAYKALGTEAGGAADQIQRLTNAVDAQNRQENAVDDARLKAAQAQTNLTQGVTNGASIKVTDAGSVDLSDYQNTSAQALLKNIETLQSGYASAISAAKLLGEQNHESQQQIQADVQRTSDAYLNQARQQLVALGIPVPAIDALLQRYNLLQGQRVMNLIANPKPAEDQIQQFQDRLNRRPLSMQLLLQGQYKSTDLGQQVGPLDFGILSGHATGGFLPTTGPGTGTRDGIVAATAAGVPVARVDGGEHITRREMTRKYPQELQQINAGTFPKLPGYLNGGVLPEEQNKLGGGAVNTSLWTLVKGRFPNAELSSGYRAGDPGYHGIKQAIDVGGPMQQVADFLYGMKDQLAQIIWNPGPTWYNVKRNQIGTGVATADGAAARAVYGEATMAGHGDHVHVAAEQPVRGAPTPGAGATPNASTTTTQQVTYTQAPLPGSASSAELTVLSGKASVDSANQERNKIYADPSSSPADKQAADIKYQQAQNSLQDAMKPEKDKDLEAISVPGMFSKAGDILGKGLLSFFGLEGSVLAGDNPYNKAVTDSIAGIQEKKTTPQGYAYVPQNLPATVTTTVDTPVSPGAAVAQAPAANQVPTFKYDPAKGAEQWRPLFEAALIKQGYPVNKAEVDAWIRQTDTESSGNPDIAQQIVDSNGTGESAGVGGGQMIPATWAAYRDPSLSDNRRDPWAMANAMVRYGHRKYPDNLLGVIGQGHGYDQGGHARGLGFMQKQILEPERVLSPRQTRTYDMTLPILESIRDSGSFALPSAAAAAPTPAGPVTHDHSTHLNGPITVMNLDELMAEFDRRQTMAAMGTVG